jgi:hypothetical protein
MTCTLTPEQHEEFFKLVASDLYALQKGNKPFNFKEYAKGIYDLVYTASKDHALALSYVSFIPQNIRIAQRDEDIAELTAEEYKIVLGQGKTFKENLEVIEKFLGIYPVNKENVKKQIVNDEQISNTPAPPEIPVKRGYQEFKGKPVSPYASVSQEAYFLDFTDPNVDRSKENLTDPGKAYHAKAIRGVLEAQSEQQVPFEEVIYQGEKGFKFRLMSLDDIPENSLYPEIIQAREEYQKGNPKLSKFLKNIYGVDKLVLVLADREGQPYRFNDKGEITGRSEDKVVFQFLRVPIKTAKGRYVQEYSPVMSPMEMLQKQVSRERKAQGLPAIVLNEKELPKEYQARLDQLWAIRNKEFQSILDLAEYAKRTTAAVVLPITGGSIGYFGQEEKKKDGQYVYRNPLSATVASLEDIKNIRINDDNGFTTLTIGIVPVPVQVDRAVFPSEYARKIADILTKNLTVDGVKLSDGDKVAYVEQFIVPNSKDRDTIDYDPNVENSIVFTISGKKINPAEAGAADAIYNGLVNQTKRLNIKKSLLESGRFTDYDVTGDTAVRKEKNYWQFIKDHQFVFAQLNSKGEVALLNPYMTYTIPTDVQANMKAQTARVQRNPILTKQETKESVQNKGVLRLRDWMDDKARANKNRISYFKDLIKGLKKAAQKKRAEDWSKNSPSSFDTGLYVPFVEGMTEDDYYNEVLKLSNNPVEIAAAYATAQEIKTDDLQGDMKYAIYQFFRDGNYVRTEDVTRMFGSNVTNSKNMPGLRFYTRKNGMSLDSALQGIAEYMGRVENPRDIGIEHQDIADFIEDYAGGPHEFIKNLKGSNTGKELKKKFEAIMGVTLTDTVADNLGRYFPTGQANATPVTLEQLETLKDTQVEKQKEDLLNKTFEKKDTKFDTNLLKKLKSIDNTATQSQIDAAKKWYDNHPISKHIPYETLFNIVNSDAFADWTLDGIRLYQGSNFTDLYHEAWHGFTQLYLTQEQKNELYDEIRRTVKGTFTNHLGDVVEFETATNLDLEEYLAEDFRKYAMNGKVNVNQPKRNSIFRKILEFLDWLFTGYTPTELITQPKQLAKVKELYDNLYFGELNKYKYAVDNTSFTNLKKGMKTLNNEKEERSLQDSKLISDTIDSIFSDVINEQNTVNGTNAFTGSVFLNAELMKNVYGEAYNRMVDLHQQFKNKALEAEDNEDDAALQEALQNVNLLAWTLDNWGDPEAVLSGKQDTGVIAYHYKKSKYLATSFQYIAKDEDKTSDEKDINESYGDRLGNDKSIKELAAAEILWLVKSLHKMRNGEPVLNKLGVKELVDFDMTWNSLVRAVSDAYDKGDMYNKLLQQAPLHPEFYELAEKLGEPYSEKFEDTEVQINPTYAFDMWTRFFRDLRKAETNLIQLTIYKDGKDGDLSYTTRAGESSSDTNVTKRDFVSRFKNSTPKTNPFVTIDENRNVRLNLEKVVHSFGKSIPEGKEYEFLRAIGFFLDEDPTGHLHTLLQQQRRVLGIDHIYRQLKIAYQYHKETGKVAITDPIDFLSRKHPDISVKADGSTIRLDRDMSGNVKRILEFHTKNSSTSGFSVLTAESTVKYKHRQHCSISQMVAAINKAKTYQELISMKETKHFDMEVNPLVEGSVLLNSVFDLKRVDDDGLPNPHFGQKRRTSAVENAPFVKLNVDDFSGAQILANDGSYALTGVATANADKTTKFLTEFHTMLMNGWMELTRHGSKSTTLAMTADRLYTYTGKENNFLYVDSKAFYSTEGAPEQYAGWNHAFNIIKGYMNGELKRIVEVRANRDAYLNAKGYNRKLADGRIAGEVFTLFDDVFKDITKEALYEMVWDGKQAKGDFLTLSALPENAALMKTVREEFKTYFDKVVERHEKLLNENKFVSAELVNQFKESFNNGERVTWNNQRIEKALVRSFVFNSWMQYAESSFVLYGDFAQYNHAKRDFHKRNSAFSSTGDIPVTDQGSIDFVNSRMGRKYFEKLKEEGFIPEDQVTKKFNGTFDTAVLKDMDTPSAYLSVYEGIFRNYLKGLYTDEKVIEAKLKSMIKPYKKMTEGDGQGWISMDSFRIFKKLIGQWGPKQEALYQKILKGEPVKSAQGLTYFEPVKVQYAGPLQNSVKDKGLPVTALHKFSLYPLVPGVITGTNLDNLHKQMVKQGIDYALFESGSKIGGITSNGEYDVFYTQEDGERSVNDQLQFTRNTVHLSYFKNQQNIANEFKGKTTFSTQLRGLILDGLEEQGIPVDFMVGTPITEKRLAWEKLSHEQKLQASPFFAMGEVLKKNIDRLTELKKQELLREAGWKEDPKTGELTGSMKDLLYEVVIPELEKRDIAEHDLEFVEIDETTGEIKYDLSLHYNADKIEKFLTSIINNRLIKQKATGESLVQVAASMFENLGYKNKFRAASEAEKLKYLGTNDLPTYQPGSAVKAPKTVEITFGDDNTAKILSGEKTTTVRQGRDADRIGLKKGESGVVTIDGKKYVVTSRGEQTIDEAGGAAAMAKSEALPKNPTASNKNVVVAGGIRYYTMFKGTAEWLKGKGTLTVYDIKPFDEKEYADTGVQGKTVAAKVKIAMQGNFEHLLNNIDVLERSVRNNISVLQALNELVKDEEWLNKGNNRKMITMVGVRIPVQGLNSMEFMEVYEFLPPNAGNIIVLPSEIVAKSGGDFDIDKLTVLMPTLYSDGTYAVRTHENYEELDKLIKEEEASFKSEWEKLKQGLDSFKDQTFAKRNITKERIAEMVRLKDEAVERKVDALKQIRELLAITTNEKIPAALKDAHNAADEVLEGILEARAHKLEKMDDSLYSLYEEFKEVNDGTIEEINTTLNNLRTENKELFKVVEDAENEAYGHRREARKHLNDLKEKRRKFTNTVENDLIDNIRSILELPHNFVSLIRPNDTDIAKPISQELAKHTRSYQEKMRLMSEQTEGVSPTRIMENEFNIHIHEANRVGKDSLGIAAKENKYKSMFNDIGAYLKDTYLWERNTSRKQERQDRRTKLLLNHNTYEYVENGIKKYGLSLSDLYDKTKQERIGDVISQIMNGLVDVEKDDWAADIQANKELTPTLLFLVTAGVPLREAAFFVSQPLVQEYVAKQRLYKSTFADPLGKGLDNPNFYRVQAKKDMIQELAESGKLVDFEVEEKMKFIQGRSAPDMSGTDYKLLEREAEKFVRERNISPYFYSQQTGDFVVKASGLHNYIQLYTNLAFKGKEIPMDTLEGVVAGKLKKDSQESIGAFLHFLEIQDLMEGIAQLKFKTNVDTKKDTSLFESAMRDRDIQLLSQSTKIPTELIHRFKEESVIGSFFIQEFTNKLFNKFFPFRTNPSYTDFKIYKMKQKSTGEDVESTFGDEEKFLKALDNDLVSFVFQNHIKGFNFSKEKYKGFTMKEAADIKYVDNLKFGVFIKDSVIYIDKDQLRKDFSGKLYTKAAEKQENSYAKRGLAPLEESVFQFHGKKSENEFYHYVVEREYLRSITPVPTGMGKEEYEVMLRDQALQNIFNLYTLFVDRETSVGNQFIKLINKYPKLIDDYGLVNNMGVDVDLKNNISNIVLRDKSLDADKVDSFYQNFQELTDPAKQPADVVDFFNRLPIYAYMQSGISRSKYSITEVVTQKPFLDLMEQPVKDFMQNYLNTWNEMSKDQIQKMIGEDAAKALTNKLDNDPSFVLWNDLIGAKKVNGKYMINPNMWMLEGFYQNFVVKNQFRERTVNNRYKDYIITRNRNEVIRKAAAMINHGVRFPDAERKTPVFEFLKKDGEKNLDFNKRIKNSVILDPQALYVFNDNFEDAQEGKARDNFENIMREAENAFGIRSTKSIVPTWNVNAPERFEEVKGYIEQDLKPLIEARDAGRTILFSKKGYGTDLKGNDHQVYLYLSKRLYEEFGYINPGYLNTESGLGQVNERQGISDKEVLEKLKECFNI